MASRSPGARRALHFVTKTTQQTKLMRPKQPQPLFYATRRMSNIRINSDLTHSTIDYDQLFTFLWFFTAGVFLEYCQVNHTELLNSVLI